MKRLSEKTIKKLITEARKAKKNSYAPYSGFRVGAAVIGRGGKIFRGCNVENASYGLTICAERAAVFNAISSGVKEITAIAVACDDGYLCSPCGACRQVIYEFSKDCQIIMDGRKGYKLSTIKELLPLGFIKG